MGAQQTFVAQDDTVLVGRRLLVTSFCLSLCTQAAKGGTVKASSGFNAAEDAQTLRKAMKGLGKCPTGGEHALCVPHPRVAQRVLCPQANVCLTLRKHSGDKVTFQGKLEWRAFTIDLNVMNSF